MTTTTPPQAPTEPVEAKEGPTVTTETTATQDGQATPPKADAPTEEKVGEKIGKSRRRVTDGVRHFFQRPKVRKTGHVINKTADGVIKVGQVFIVLAVGNATYRQAKSAYQASQQPTPDNVTDMTAPKASRASA